MRDADVRLALRRQLVADHGDDPNTRIVEEMGIWAGAVRIDMAIINGELVGYELKSDSDTLDRLPNQAEIYSKVFDRITLVTGVKHLDGALDIIPEWWGCVIAEMSDGAVNLRSIRAPQTNPALDLSILVQLLWKSEALTILNKFGLDKGWRSKPAAEVTARLVSSLSPETLCEEVRAILKTREKLGQPTAGNLDMPIYVEPDPSTRTTS